MNNAEQSLCEGKALISYDGVAISHDEHEVVKGVTFSVYPKDFIFLTGNVGSGKSSILRTIYKDLDFSAGKGCVLGYDLSKIRRKQIPDLRKQLGIIFQDYKLLGNLTVWENLTFVLKATGVKKEEIGKRIDETLKQIPERTFRGRAAAGGHCAGNNQQPQGYPCRRAYGKPRQKCRNGNHPPFGKD